MRTTPSIFVTRVFSLARVLGAELRNRMAGSIGLWSLALAAALGLLAAGSAMAQNDPIGQQALLAQFAAAALPAPGTGVVVEQIEAPVPGDNNALLYYMPDNFSGVTITDEIGGGAVSWHATNVADIFYGTGGVASGVSQVDVYEANYWFNNILGVGNPIGPAAGPADNPAVANLSFVGTTGVPLYDNDALRRFDYMINRDNLVAVVAVDNGAASAVPPLMASGYDSIAVGVSNAQSSLGPIPSGVEGVGRSKPDIVAPQNATSYATPDVSAAAAMLVQVARSNMAYALAANNSPAVIKAILMAGTDKNPLPTWSRTPTQPLDPQYGAGQVNLDRAYKILTAGPQTSSSSSLVTSTGWNYESIQPSGDSKTYYFQVPSGQPFDLSALLTWERTVAYTPSGGTDMATFTPSLATIDLDLYHANGNYTLGSLVDSSSSAIDNVQYVFDRGLTTDEYALKVTRVDALSGAWNYALAWQLQTVPHWASAVSGSWNDASKWDNDLNPSGVGREADLDASTTATLGVALDAPQTIGELTLANTASNYAGYSISAGSAGTLTFDNGPSTATLTLLSGSHSILAPVILAGDLAVTASSGAALDLSGNITETGGSRSLSMTGSGSLQLDGSNSYTGGTIVNSGTVTFSVAGALPSSGDLAIGAGGDVILGLGGMGAPAPSSEISANTRPLSPVPEPSSMALLGVATVAILTRVYRRRRCR